MFLELQMSLSDSELKFSKRNDNDIGSPIFCAHFNKQNVLFKQVLFLVKATESSNH